MTVPDYTDTSGQACAKPETTEERVNFIADMMENLSWERGKSARRLAKEWGLSEKTIQGYSAEASRRVVADAEDARRDITAGCRKLFRDSVNAMDARGARAVGELWATVSGAKAPERHQVTTVEASPEAAAAAVREAFGDQARRDDSDESGDAA